MRDRHRPLLPLREGGVVNAEYLGPRHGIGGGHQQTQGVLDPKLSQVVIKVLVVNCAPGLA
jgi:hypothetical protein